MALTSKQQWRVAPDGAEINGGGFDPSLTAGMLTDGAATSATGTAPVFSSASYNFAAGDVGALLYIAAGTNWTPGWYPIASVAANAATLTASIDATLGGARKANGDALTANGCATTGSPTGATFTIDYTAITATPIVAVTDLASANSTTVTSASNPFTKVMIGNVIRLASSGGTSTSGYFAIVTYTNAGSIVADRASGTTYTAGVAKVGGAVGSSTILLKNFSTGGGLTAAITSPLAPGHIINLKGGGTDDPSGADYTPSSSNLIDAGSTSTGLNYVKGYNGRPNIALDPLAIRFSFIKWSNVKFTAVNDGICLDPNTANSGHDFENIIWDQAGKDATLSNCVQTLTFSLLKNTGSTSSGTRATLLTCIHGSVVCMNRFQDQRGWAVDIVGGQSVIGNVITNCRNTSHGAIESNAAEDVGSMIVGNTLDGNQGDGIRLGAKVDCWFRVIFNNLMTNNVGYGLNANIGASGDPFFAHQPNYNAYYNNTAGARQNASAGDHDVTLSADPYTNLAGGDFTLNSTAGGGADCRRAAMAPPDPDGDTVSIPDIGALQS